MTWKPQISCLVHWKKNPKNEHAGADILQNLSFTFTGTSDTDKCAEGVYSIFDFTCTNCTFNKTYMPPIHGQYYVRLEDVLNKGLDKKMDHFKPVKLSVL